MVLFCKKRKLITRDMADDAMDLLELVKATNNEVTKHNFFEHGDEDFKKFLNTFEKNDTEWKIPFLTLFYGALRIGEWLAIQKKDINFEESVILINKQVNMLGILKNRVKNGEDKLVRLPKTFVLELKQWIEDRQFGDNDFIFQNNNTGKPYSRYFISNLLKNHLKEAGLEEMTPHGLRHSFATRMFDKGYDVKEVQEQLGHKNMNTTMNYYIHYTKNKHKKDLDDLL